MAETLVTLKIRTDGTPEIVRAGKAMDTAHKSTTRWSGALGVAGGAFSRLTSTIRAHPIASILASYFAVTTIRSFSSAVMESAAAQEEALTKIQSAIISQGKNWDDYKSKVLSVTSALQRKTTFADDKQLEALSELTTVLGDVNKAMEYLPIVLDVSARHGLDLVSSSRAIGLALKGDLGLIGRYVPALRGLTEEQKTQDNVLRILNQTYKGTAETLAQTSSGALRQAANAWDDVKEGIGFVLIDALAPFTREWTTFFEGLSSSLELLRSGKQTFKDFAEEGVGRAASLIVDQGSVILNAGVPVFLKAGEELGIAVGEGLIRKFLDITGKHPILASALGAVTGAGVGGLAGGLPGAVVGGAAGAFAPLGVAAAGESVLADISQEKAGRAEERLRQSQLLSGVSPTTALAFQKAGVIRGSAIPAESELGQAMLAELKEINRKISIRSADTHFVN